MYELNDIQIEVASRETASQPFPVGNLNLTSTFSHIGFPRLLIFLREPDWLSLCCANRKLNEILSRNNIINDTFIVHYKMNKHIEVKDGYGRMVNKNIKDADKQHAETQFQITSIISKCKAIQSILNYVSLGVIFGFLFVILPILTSWEEKVGSFSYNYSKISFLVSYIIVAICLFIQLLVAICYYMAMQGMKTTKTQVEN